MTDDKDSAVINGYEYSGYCLKANDNRALLTIKPDGTVTGEIEDASEAARLFVESLRGYLRQPTQSDALVAENKRLREALGWFLNDSRFVVQVGGNPNVVPQMIEARGLEIRDKSK